MKYFSVVLILAGLLISGLFVASGVEGQAQPTQINISNVQPSNIYPGTVVQVRGGQYLPVNGDTGSVIWFPEFEAAVDAYYVSSSELLFMVPFGNHVCGEQGIVVRNYVNLNNQITPVESNFVVIDVNCPNPNRLQPPTPRVTSVQLLDTIGDTAIEIHGSEFLLPADAPNFGGGQAYPYSEVIVYNEEYEYSGPGNFRAFGEMRFEFDERPYCGTYNVQVRNHFSSEDSSSSSSLSSASTVDINQQCEGNGPVEELPSGGYEVMNLDLPSTAYVDEQIQGSVQVKKTSTFYGRNSNGEMELYVDGDLRDTQELEMDPNETLTFPLAFRFDHPGSFDVEIRVGESYQHKAIEVSSRNGNTSPPPTQGGNTLADYDMDGDCVMSDTEFFVATDAWITESISDLLFFSAVDAWIGQSNICTTSASSQSINLMMSMYGMQFSTSVGVSLGVVAIYDSNGREVYSQRTSSNKLFWNLRDHNNQPVANGVYWVRTGKGEFRKILILR